jgi:hypothetical protein
MANRSRPDSIILCLITLLVGPGCAFLPERGVQAPWTTREELKARLGNPEVIILDVRKKADWEASGQKIPGAVHEDYEGVKDWSIKYPRDKTMVLYCA